MDFARRRMNLTNDCRDIAGERRDSGALDFVFAVNRRAAFRFANCKYKLNL